ncbi:MAG: tRNA uridine-5-carboxymethylaminomethyl(34) synthesis GTPase MnmE [Dysgonamonadaceae bacterium]|jgi:tRNA modification GTPase|nr:tRNA uridine-5-carboxymethylaminomethyl(34) synthesis GTPase MnmE [Dysgonamonadaceae bacterium]
MTSNSTICAVSTVPGAGGIAVIRISGKEALSITDKIYEPVKKTTSFVRQETHTLTFGKIMNNENILDEVIVAVFRAPNSYTGEDAVEITCHGSIYIQQEILRLLIKNGCRLAKPGEFTQRSFLNGKMDLSQAEAVADLVASASTASHRMAMNQMRGGFSKELQNLRSQLLNFVSMIELELDFGEENVEFADRSQLLSLALNIKLTITKLVKSFQLGNAIKNGIPVVIVGETNVGKSTLLNHLLNEERAIVSEIHGTTRDTIEDVISISGISFRLIDTAGLRDTGNEIEILGIERTYQKIDQASIVVWMIDATQFSEKIENVAEKIIPKTKNKRLIIVINKIDKLSTEERLVLDDEFLPQIPAKRIYLSAKYKQNTTELEEALIKAADIPKLNENDVVVSNIRHYEALSKALESINRVEKGLKKAISGDFIAQDIRECMHYLGEITGEISTDEVLGNIFKNFCIGK